MKVANNTIFFLILSILCLCLQNVRCDLPVHCHLDQIVGEWNFYIGEETFVPELENIKTTCGHGFPNHIEQGTADLDIYLPSSKTVTITLDKDSNVYEKGEKVGDFTLVYDEGFILKYRESVFTAHMKYYKNKDTNKFMSNCSKTMLGWYVKDYNKPKENWSCFYGKKTKLESANTNFLQGIMLKHTDSDTDIKENKDDKETSNKDVDKELYDEQTEIVDELNSMGLTWKAGLNNNFKGKTMREINDHSSFGIRRSRKHKEKEDSGALIKSLQDMIEKTPNLIQLNARSNTNIRLKSKEKKNNRSFQEMQYDEAAKYINSELNDIPENELLTAWDWRNIGGINYVSDVREQGDCGSCYVFSALSSLESRLRILTNNQDQTTFSRQFILSCGIYTEGCEGGYPILVGKFAHEFELLPEYCMPYNPSKLTCSNFCKYQELTKKYTVSKYEYLGGHYGATNELLMMKEIRARGPIPGNMMAPWTFTYYKSGVYSSKDIKQKSKKDLSKVTLFDKNLYWEAVEHSILIVGWGEENGVKYWICMNSWGKNWGDNGFFKVLRGEDAEHIESMGDVMRIKVDYRVITQ